MQAQLIKYTCFQHFALNSQIILNVPTVGETYFP